MAVKLERQQNILGWLDDHRKSTIPELSEIFEVSDVTIRRDLKALEEEGLVQLMHGGSVHRIVADRVEPPILKRQHDNQAAKLRIARAAASLVHDGESVFVGSGSTAMYVARFLRERRGLTVITNALTVVEELAPYDDVNVIILGGMLRPSELSMIGHVTEQTLREVRVDKVFIGIRGIDLAAGLTNDHMPEVMTDRAILAMGAHVILLADHTKFGRIASSFVAPVSDVSIVITDDQSPLDMLNAIREQGIEVIVG